MALGSFMLGSMDLRLAFCGAACVVVVVVVVVGLFVFVVAR